MKALGTKTPTGNKLNRKEIQQEIYVAGNKSTGKRATGKSATGKSATGKSSTEKCQQERRQHERVSRKETQQERLSTKGPQKGGSIKVKSKSFE